MRDIDIVQETLRHHAEDLQEPLEPLFQSLARQRSEARDALIEALHGERYPDLRLRLIEAGRFPAVWEDAEEPGRTVLPGLAARLWKKVRKAGRALGEDSPEADFHETRKRGKDARVAARSVARVLDSGTRKEAKRFARLMDDVVSILGEHQDAVVVRRTVREMAAEHPGDDPVNLVAGRLVERLEQAANENCARFFEAWEKVDRKKRRAWMKV